jgi:hypothetical protein
VGGFGACGGLTPPPPPAALGAVRIDPRPALQRFSQEAE